MTVTECLVRLHTDQTRRPLRIDARTPRFNWAYEPADQRRQTTFRVLVASDLDQLAADNGDVWDSGWIGREKQTVEYDGEQLTSRTRYW